MIPNKFERLLSDAYRYSNNDMDTDFLDEIDNLSQTSSSVLRETSCFLDFPDISNIIDLDSKADEHVTSFLKYRYVNKEFYTWAGQTLIAIHPYEDLTSQMQANSNAPSIDAVVSRAWFKLSHNIGKPNQAVVISGESGSGKTYSACLAMKSIAALQKNNSTNPVENILWQAWSSVPLLTAFGNAPNEHNNNSSRFGKLLQLQYDNEQIVGAFIKTYLLEKSRVTGPNFKEGNFHIFQQVLDSVDVETLTTLHLDKNIVYKIVPKPENALKSTYLETVKALNILNINELGEILTILSIILNLGNVNFRMRDDTCYVSKESQMFLHNATRLLQIDTKSALNVLVTKTFMAKGRGNKRDTVYVSPCVNQEECKERRNCLMRFLYDKLFLWLVDRINEQIYVEGDYKSIGILDVYGFEVFDNNTFEQLCINYANERLQQYFVNDYLVKQQRELISEGFFMENIDTTDYAARVDILDGPMSVFGILNEECAMKRFNTDVFVNIRLAENLGESPYFQNPSNNFSTLFVIKHYAGNVTYNTTSMLYKNRDKVPDEMISFLKECKFPFLECILEVNDQKLEGGKTLLNKFKKSLDNLVQTLNAADVHYIKCLKPNSFLINGFMDEPYFTQQMRANGLLDILKLHFQSYYIKFNMEEFIRKFSCHLFNCLQYIFKMDIHVGKKFIYLTENGYTAFETLKYIDNCIAARKIQICWKRYKERRYRAATVIQNFYRSILLKRKFPSIENFIDLSKKSSDILIGQEIVHTHINAKNYFNSCRKAEEYLKMHHLNGNFEGEPLSLNLEKVFNSLRTKPFRRVLYSGDHIISYNKLAEIPVRLHLSKTCIPHSNLLPKSELSKGLPDIF